MLKSLKTKKSILITLIIAVSAISVLAKLGWLPLPVWAQGSRTTASIMVTDPVAFGPHVTFTTSGGCYTPTGGVCSGNTTTTTWSATNNIPITTTLSYVSITPGYRFDGWSGGGCSGTGPCTVSIPRGSSVVITANSSPITPVYGYTASWLGTSDPAIVGGIVNKGQTYKLYTQLQKTSPGSGSNIQHTVSYPTNGSISTGSADQSSPAANNRGLTGTFCQVGFAPCWYWTFSSYPSGQTTVASFNFTVSSSAVSGSQICFSVGAHSLDSTEAVAARSQQCYTVGEPAATTGAPYLSTAYGSVHAGARFGDKPCLITPGNGDINGQTGASQGSKADYVVSAGGSVSNFGSGGSPSGANLTFANYGQICREDIAARYIDNSSIPTLPQSNVAVSDLANGIARANGNITITGGTVGRGQRSTLVVNGNVYISGNIAHASTGYTSVANIPSLGIVATGNIHIAPGVSTLYGIYYAGSALSGSTGIINTCQSGHGVIPNPGITSGGAAQCNGNLTIEGALVATNIYFRRTGGNAQSAGSAAAETVTYLPQLILRPPLGLGGVASQL